MAKRFPYLFYPGKTGEPRPRSGDAKCAAHDANASWIYNPIRCKNKAKDILTAEVLESLLTGDSAKDAYEYTVRDLRDKATPLVGYGWCGRHSPARVITDALLASVTSRARAEAYTAASDAKQSREKAIGDRIHAILGFGGWARETDMPMGDKWGRAYAIPADVIDALLKRLEATR